MYGHKRAHKRSYQKGQYHYCDYIANTDRGQKIHEIEKHSFKQWEFRVMIKNE